MPPTVRLIPAHAGKTTATLCAANSSRAHPRSRGENWEPMRAARVCTGSSPLTRGKRWWRPPPSRPCGLIPAHAGKTFLVVGGGDTAPAHPRSRGENRRSCLICSMILGSSPLTRGKRSGSGLRGVSVGLIPAHAGKTRYSRRPLQPIGAHPRSRGENPVEHFTAACMAGSSPLTRGKRSRGRSVRLHCGLIPAHAGKTGRRPACRPRSGAHPRSRGENRHSC